MEVLINPVHLKTWDEVASECSHTLKAYSALQKHERLQKHIARGYQARAVLLQGIPYLHHRHVPVIVPHQQSVQTRSVRENAYGPIS